MADREALRRAYITADADVQGHIHANLRSMPLTQSHARRWAKRFNELRAARDAAHAELEALPAPPAPSRLERLQATASGHPDNASVQAARRILHTHWPDKFGPNHWET